MTPRKLKDKFIEFFLSKNHQEIPSSSLVPENDPTTLFVSAGIQPLAPYFLGKKHPVGSRLVNVQKCVRTCDIDLVGDAFHHTFFEMLGNWSLGDYFKKEMIPWSFEFLTKELNINADHLYATCFAGDKDAPKDNVSANFWQKLGIPKKRIHFLPKKENWWGPAGTTGPCGPDSEMFVDISPNSPPIDFKKGCDSGRFREIWNDVFIQYLKNEKGKFEKLVQNNIDTGMGVERNIAILNSFTDHYLTVIWQPIIKKIEEISGEKYTTDNIRPMRIIADHLRSAVFIIADGMQPSNKEAGYVLRRLIRRAVRQAKLIGIENNFTEKIGQTVLNNQNNYAGIYPELNQNADLILATLENEENKFRKTLNKGLRQIQKMISSDKKITGKDAFDLYQNYGFPCEMTKEELEKHGLKFSSKEYKEFCSCNSDHQAKSRTLSVGKFKSGLADNSEIITKYHTTTHLLNSALRQVLGDHVWQAGSNITKERLRFDFVHQDKLTDKEKQQTEDLVNEKIKKALPVSCQTMNITDVKNNSSIVAIFGAKYPDKVTVYTIGNLKKSFSKEVCTGPHVKNTSELGSFCILKEESCGSGRRRIYAKLM
ncbi:alanine--tRNA ligase [Patescibacteria group bacterium]|nr:alanine--tRNA ligase [Patescibacteria group bacterium]MCG2701552.1 alanine--tRNA ligase [Candidatus Parcubacteria bacterium]MBU4264480.1 alanine--tRNA ligase [Patescibacteria group bacterium]MBU4390411.1 alanine--tRNA ligase [Patescibacteria group bacterium]MBU4396732.1 alanine--tRNA ligase [Patescibacteria group bacterium]